MEMAKDDEDPLEEELMEVDRSTLFLHRKADNTLYTLVADGALAITIPCDKGLAGAAFTSKKMINIPDAYKDDRFNPEVDRKTGFMTRSILCMPILSRNRDVIGVTQMLNKRAGPFGAEAYVKREGTNVGQEQTCVRD